MNSAEKKRSRSPSTPGKDRHYPDMAFFDTNKAKSADFIQRKPSITKDNSVDKFMNKPRMASSMYPGKIV